MNDPHFHRHDEHVFLGHETVYPSSAACCCAEHSAKMKPGGWALVITLAVFAFPIAWVPFVLPCCHHPYTRPVYGKPPSTATKASMGAINFRSAGLPTTKGD
jgi:hypothetical protein